jgi:hypothetical protein
VIGRRVQPDENGWLTTPFQPGDYGRASPHRMADGSEISPAFAEAFRVAWWQVRCPNGHSGCLSPDVHTVTEHEDGTITVSPSIVISGANGEQLWHGYLERGVWRSC